MDNEVYTLGPERAFLKKALKVAEEESTCDRARVGAIIAYRTIELSRGANTAPTGTPTCDEEGHLMIDGHCCRTVHAEHNAILNALCNGRDPRGATMYVTHEPCIHCRKVIIQLGIKRVIFIYKYRSNQLTTEAMSGDVEWIHFNEPL